MIVKAIKRYYLHAAERKWATIVSKDEICFCHPENTDMAIIHADNNLVMADSSDTIDLTTIVRYSLHLNLEMAPWMSYNLPQFQLFVSTPRN